VEVLTAIEKKLEAQNKSLEKLNDKIGWLHFLVALIFAWIAWWMAFGKVLIEPVRGSIGY